MDIVTKQIIHSISEAYETILSEGKESKFNVGDKVGIGHSSSYGYRPHDTGTVVKVNAHGHHAVEFDNRKSSDDPTKPYTEQFDRTGVSRKEYSNSILIPHDKHVDHVKTINDRNERSRDMDILLGHITGHRTGAGHYVPFDEETAKTIKALVDKHTEIKK